MDKLLIKATTKPTNESEITRSLQQFLGNHPPKSDASESDWQVWTGKCMEMAILHDQSLCGLPRSPEFQKTLYNYVKALQMAVRHNWGDWIETHCPGLRKKLKDNLEEDLPMPPSPETTLLPIVESGDANPTASQLGRSIKENVMKKAKSSKRTKRVKLVDPTIVPDPIPTHISTNSWNLLLSSGKMKMWHDTQQERGAPQCDACQQHQYLCLRKSGVRSSKCLHCNVAREDCSLVKEQTEVTAPNPPKNLSPAATRVKRKISAPLTQAGESSPKRLRKQVEDSVNDAMTLAHPEDQQLMANQMSASLRVKIYKALRDCFDAQLVQAESEYAALLAQPTEGDL